MSKFYRANTELKTYLESLGLTFHDREDPEVNYLTDHKSGKQVKVDIKNSLVTLLDNSGDIIDQSSSFTDNQIKSFLN
jgi:hypothetical protein